MMKNILILGDSLTDAGRDKKNEKDLGQGYVRTIQNEMPETTVINRGFNGARAIDLLFEVENLATEIQGADALVLFIGVNDVWSSQYRSEADWASKLESFTGHFALLIDSISKHLPAQSSVYIVLPFARFAKDTEDGQILRDRLEQLNGVIRQIITDFKPDYIIVDLRQQLESAGFDWQGGLAVDGVHWSSEMHEFVGKEMADVLGRFVL
ncbi:SGNH/GDSL hydrolase family protein [Aerococcus agrisoli]|nr:SGNH/GDSL hydrolase family protein [Aerococcus agrisoli]